MDKFFSPRSNPEKRTLRDTYRMRIEAIETEEKQQKEFELTKRLFRVYKTRLDTLDKKIPSIRKIFDDANTEAHQLQKTADILLKRIVNIKSSKKEFINNIISKAIMTKKFYYDLYTNMPPEILLMVHPHADANYKKAVRKEISQYLESEGFNHQDFEDVLDTLTEVDNSLSPQDIERQLKERLLKELGLKKVIDTQNQVFECMANANRTTRKRLAGMYSKFGNLDRFFKSASHYYFASDNGGRERIITPIFKINIDDNYKKISYENDKDSFTSTKTANWERFSNNRSTILIKVEDFSMCLGEIYNTFQ